MEQKRAMLYPQVDFNSPSAPLPTPTPTGEHATSGVGPVEAPPSYDVAIAAVPSAPANIVIAQPASAHQPQQQHQQYTPPQQQQQQSQQQPQEPTFVPAGKRELVKKQLQNKQLKVLFNSRSSIESRSQSLSCAVPGLRCTEDDAHDAYGQLTNSPGCWAYLSGWVGFVYNIASKSRSICILRILFCISVGVSVPALFPTA